MREKELRLALVFFGGVSLAIYMHGISKEILKLVRASSALHAITDRSVRVRTQAADVFDPDDPEFDTEAVYFDLLREIGRKIDLRVIVDIVAGASAGGINGVMLARALSHNLSFGKLRDLWLDDADVSELLAAERRATTWSKWFLKPLIWGVRQMGVLQSIQDLEVRSKVSLFVRSRWFKPPFDGSRMTELMLDGLQGMAPLKRTSSPSLLPTNQYLELFVTVTDFYGYQQLIQIHDPPFIREREHRHIMRFSCRHWPSGAIESDFDQENAPSLAFAARATSAFPGAFPPASIGEVDRLLARRGLGWTTRATFLQKNFALYYQAGMDPLATSFIDGSVLNNKPFSEAIRSIKGRPAYREVDRRLVYIDPDPRRTPPPLTGRTPGFFETLKNALSDIPRNEPIADELEWVGANNARVRRMKAIIDGARPQIAQLVMDITPAANGEPFTIAEIQSWRKAVNVHVAESAGFAYEGYVRLKLLSAIAFVSRSIGELCGLEERSLGATAIAAVMEVWAQREGIVYGGGEVRVMHRDAQGAAQDFPRWIRFLLEFDVEFRKRRLGFLIQGQNRLYQILDVDGLDSEVAKLINKLKRKFYQCLDALRRCEHPESFSAGTRSLANSLFGTLPTREEAGDMNQYARNFVQHRGDELNRLIDALAAEVDLNAATDDVDKLLSGMDQSVWKPQIRREVLTNYLGFPFWDLLTFSVTSWRDAGEFNEVRVDRISPEDSSMSRTADGRIGLKGTELAHFGAFFSRAYRENDYLIGRLNAVERLIDIVCDAAKLDPSGLGIDVVALKRRAIRIILDAERPHLKNIANSPIWQSSVTPKADDI